MKACLSGVCFSVVQRDVPGSPAVLEFVLSVQGLQV